MLSVVHIPVYCKVSEDIRWLCLQSGLTSLHVVSFMGYMNITLYLLQHGSNPNTTTVRGETALHLAARANQTEIIRILLRNGASVDARARVSHSSFSLFDFNLFVN